MKTKDLKVIWR